MSLTDSGEAQQPLFLNDPHGFTPLDASPLAREEGASFDASQHLQVLPPEFVYDQHFHKVPWISGQRVPSFSAAGPFQLLSSAGVSELRAVIEDHKGDPRIARSDARAPLYLRGLGFVSPFVSGFAESREVCDFLTQLSGDALAPHTMLMNQGHVNYGAVGGKTVDSWHADSVEYVLIVMLSDPSKFQGGELEVIRRPNPQEAARAIEEGSLGEGDVLRVRFERMGQAVFVRGSRHVHRVMPVVGGEQPRVTCINSFISRNIFSEDATRFCTFQREPFAALEFARHKAWRAKGFLKHLESLPFGKASLEDILRDLGSARDELDHAMGLLSGQEDDEMAFFDEVSKKFVKRRVPNGSSAFDVSFRCKRSV